MNTDPLDISQSFIVQAPAGSGKTSLLTQRLLALLATVNSPEECLSLTFTRKAAAEMRHRVLQALNLAQQINKNSEKSILINDHANAQLNTPLNAHEKKTLELAQKVLKRDKELSWNLLNYPNRLQIQTIDALCANLAQRLPLTSGLGAYQSLVEDPQSFYDEAAKQLLFRLENGSKIENNINEHENNKNENSINEALKTLLSHCDNDWEAVVQLLAEMLAKRDQWLLALGGTFFTIPNRAQLEQGLIYAIEEALKYLKQNLPPQDIAEELCALISFAKQNLVTNNELNLSSKQNTEINSNANKNWPDLKIASLSKWQQIADLLLTDENEWRKTVTQKQGFPAASSSKNKEEKELFKIMKERMQNLLIKLHDYPDFALALQYLRECPPATYTEEQWFLVKSLLTVLPHLVAELILIFQKRNQVDFIEISLRAHHALGEKDSPTDLTFQLGNNLKHILVDEFQDTSLSQYLLLEKLSATFNEYEGNTLFFVGDPQQSIYRFRRADVSLFLTAKNNGLNDIKLNPITLTKNYRSNQPIITWINNTFTKLFPKKEDSILGAIPYVACEAFSELGAIPYACKPFSETIHFSEVVLKPVVEENEIENIINCVKQIKTKNINDSVAILVRSRSHLNNLIPALIKEKIPFQGVELDSLESRPIIQDLLSLTRGLIHLSDRIAWLSILRAPYCAINLKDIEIIANHKPKLPLFAALKDFQNIKNLDDDTIVTLSRIIPIFNDAVLERERTSIVKLVKNTWQKLMQNENNNSEEKTFFDLCREIEQKEDIYQLGLLEEKIRNHYISANANVLSTNENNSFFVQIMTIHKAKGLEFDCVILPGLGRREMHDPTQLLLWEERRLPNGKTYLILGPIRSAKIKKDPIYEFLRKQVRKRSEFENLRLLYVGATRAKKCLYGFVYNNFIQ